MVLDPGSGALSALMRCVDVADVDAFALSYVPGRNALPRPSPRHARGLHSLLRPRVLITKHTVLTAGQGKFSLPGCYYARSCCLTWLLRPLGLGPSDRRKKTSDPVRRQARTLQRDEKSDIIRVGFGDKRYDGWQTVIRCLGVKNNVDNTRSSTARTDTS